MTRRAYTPGERSRAVDAGRERIIAAAHDVLQTGGGEGFSIDLVATRAGVSRMTVYNQFGSKAGLLEALFDSLASRGPFAEMRKVFQETDALVALDRVIALFGEFWTLSRQAHGGLRAASLHDADLAAAMDRRNERRRTVLAAIVKRLGTRVRPAIPRAELVNVLFVLLSFESFHAFAGADRTPVDVVPLVQRIARSIVGASPTKRSATRAKTARARTVRA